METESTFTMLLARSDGIQLGLDGIGLVPGLGEIADGINAIIYFARGDKANGWLSLAAMVPIGGQAATAVKLANKALKKSKTIPKVANKAKNTLPEGFKETKKFGYQHGQKVYEHEGKYYSKDVDRHNGGAWKVFEVHSGQLKRVGTTDEHLNIIKK